MNEPAWISIYFRSGVLAMIGRKWKQIARKWGIPGLLLVCLVCGGISFMKNKRTGSGGAPCLENHIGDFLNRQMEREYFQISRYLDEEEAREETLSLAERLMIRQFLLYDYMLTQEEPQVEQEDDLMAELILRQEGTDEDYKNIDEEHLDYGEDALHIDKSVLDEMERENQLHSNESQDTPEEEQQELPKNTGTGEFQEAAYPAYTYDWSEKWDYEALISNFYAVDKSTRLKEEYADLDKLLYQDLTINQETEGPQILLYHTHASEGFLDSVPGDLSTTIVGAGDKLTELLEEKYGFQVLHHREVYDSERDNAYNETLPAITQLLEENPTIEVVIDLHRDAVSGDRKLVMDLQGRPTARFMFFNGLSYGSKSGDITYLENPYIQENLAFSFQAQVAANEYYPGIARKVYLKAYRFNMHLKPKSMLIELGAQNNTLEEILNACDPLAHILAIVLKGGI